MSEIVYSGSHTPEPGRLGLSRRRVGGADVFALAGELDRDASAELRERLVSATASSTAATIVLDLSGVTFIDAGCVRVIMGVWDATTDRGQELRVEGLHGIPDKVFDILGLKPILVHRTEAS